MYDANTAAMEMWHRAQEQAYQMEEDMADELANRMQAIADKMDLLTRQLDQRSSILLENMEAIELNVERMESALAKIWGADNA
jgi:hypothetical protein